MAYSNYRSDWNRDRNERWRSGGQRDESRDRDDDDSRRAREAMERDYYGSETGGRGGYGGRDTQSGRFSESGYGRGREYLSGEGRRHHGNETGGWEGREEEQWRNRDVHGHYDRDANYGGFSRSGTGNYGGSGGSQQGGRGYGGGGYQGGQGRGYQRGQGSWEQAGMQYSQGGYGEASSGRPSGGRAYGDYSGSPSGYFGEDYGRQGQRQSGSQGSQGQEHWGQGQDYGQHRGRGPKGYKRSDDRIREEVCDCLTDDDRLDASNIEVAVKDGEVTLSGFVTAREDKRWAESLVERISGVKEVQNSLRVQDQQRAQASSSGTQGSSTGSKDKGKDIQH